jgi:hypothetical protein
VETKTFDRDVRLAVYGFFVAEGRAPSIEEIAEDLGRPAGEVAAAFGRLEAAHVLVMERGTSTIRMAHPFSAVPTAFQVETSRGSSWGNCIWDAFGIVAMLGGDGTVSTSCADCGQPMVLPVRHGVLQEHEGVAHFAVPARRWWDDIGYT